MEMKIWLLIFILDTKIKLKFKVIKMLTIREALGKEWAEYPLYDDNSLSYGGISKEEETLGDFVKDADIDAYYDSVREVQIALKECGMKQIDEIDSKIEEILQQKIWDIEEELDIQIDDYRWDYKGF